jgi:hypothetical protein
VNEEQQDVRRRAAMLLNLAKTIRSPDLAAILVNKAADLTSPIDESGLSNVSPLPDIEPPPAD